MRLGARVELMDERHHDLVLAVTSHLPHLIAYNIVGTAADLEEVTQGEVMKYSAGGFRDFTRIAASDPIMWRDVFLTNKDAVLEILGRFTEDLQALSRAIRWGEGDKLRGSSSPAPGRSASASSRPARKAPSRTSAAIAAQTIARRGWFSRQQVRGDALARVGQVAQSGAQGVGDGVADRRQRRAERDLAHAGRARSGPISSTSTGGISSKRRIG